MQEKIKEILDQIETVIVGKNAVMERILMAILAGGHVLMEDVPGVGKTTTAMTFARVLGLETRRVQFTSDTMPSDIIGFSVYDKDTGKLVYKPGAVMTNLLLADEINRTSSKTQSALLEAMEEEQPPEQRKPHTWPLEQIMERFSLAPQELLVVDDLKPGYDMAKAAGVPFSAAGWANDIPEIEQFMRKNCDFYCKTVADLDRLLEK